MLMRKFWNGVIADMREYSVIHPTLGQYKAQEFVRIIKTWCNSFGSIKVLKTDLWEEAFEDDNILPFLIDSAAEIFAFDISDKITGRANSLSRGRHYLTADARNLPFKENTFDLILSTSTLDHFVNYDDLEAALIELKRVLKLNGSMIIALNNKHNPFFYLSLKAGRFLGLIPYVVRFYTLRELKMIFKKLGLAVEDYDSIVHIIGPLNTVSVLLKKIFGRKAVDFFIKRGAYFFKWLGRRQATKFFTGWFLVFKLTKCK